jgi:hypothetical protein
MASQMFDSDNAAFQAKPGDAKLWEIPWRSRACWHGASAMRAGRGITGIQAGHDGDACA